MPKYAVVINKMWNEGLDANSAFNLVADASNAGKQVEIFQQTTQGCYETVK